MKKYIVLIAFICTSILYGQENPIQIVFDVTTADEATHQATVRHVTLMSEAYPESEFEVVLYSQSINMVLAEKSSVSEEIEKLVANDNVSFKVCAGTMKRNKVTEADLVKGVESVPDGIVEIVSKQKAGWGYIKEARN